MENSYSYKDIDISFEQNPITGDIITVKDARAIQKAVRNIVLSKKYEKPFLSEYGGGASALLFENYDRITQSFLRQEITESILRFEPRIYDLKVEIYDEEIDINKIRLDIGFRVRNIPEPINIKVFLERVR